MTEFGERIELYMMFNILYPIVVSKCHLRPDVRQFNYSVFSLWKTMAQCFSILEHSLTVIFM